MGRYGEEPTVLCTVVPRKSGVPGASLQGSTRARIPNPNRAASGRMSTFGPTNEVTLPMIRAAVVTLTALRTGVHRALARAMARFLHGGRASIKLRQQYSVCPHIQHEWLRLACRRSAAVHDADRHDYGDGDGLNEREAEAAFRQVRADDASAEWRVGRVTVCDRRAAFGLHELQATVLGLHANRPARCVGVGQQCIASRRVS